MKRSRHISRLDRKAGNLKPKAKFTLFCEGLKTEPGYFEKLAQEIGGSLVTVEIIGAAGVPSTIAERAITYKRNLDSSRSRKNSYEKRDRIWAVFDRDEHPCFFRALIECQNAGVPTAVSDPCFELWLILHYQDFDKSDDRHRVQKYLERICGAYSASSGKAFSCDDILNKAVMALKRAEKQYTRRMAEGGLAPPYTTVFNLVSEILNSGSLSRRRSRK